MKKVLTKDLVVGREYWDLEDNTDESATKLRLIEKDGNSLIFEYVCGAKTYVFMMGKIEIFNDNDGDWYEEENINN